MWGLQSPSERLDWHQDWTDWMEAGDAIYSSTWEIDNRGEFTTAEDTPLLEDQGFEGNVTTVFVSLLTLGRSYQLRNTITTDAQRVGVREITIRCAVQA